MDNFWLRRIIIGFAIAAPVGPIGVLCIRRTLAEGRTAGVVSGLGVATADALYGCIAGFGLAAISRVLIDYQLWFQLIGGVFLLYLGVTTFFARPSETIETQRRPGLVNAYASTFVLTLTNPVTILSFTAIFAGLGLASVQANYGAALVLVTGVFCGSALWWLLLSGGVSLFRTLILSHHLRWINRFSGLLITGFGVWNSVLVVQSWLS